MASTTRVICLHVDMRGIGYWSCFGDGVYCWLCLPCQIVVELNCGSVICSLKPFSFEGVPVIFFIFIFAHSPDDLVAEIGNDQQSNHRWNTDSQHLQLSSSCPWGETWLSHKCKDNEQSQRVGNWKNVITVKTIASRMLSRFWPDSHNIRSESLRGSILDRRALDYFRHFYWWALDYLVFWRRTGNHLSIKVQGWEDCWTERHFSPPFMSSIILILACLPPHWLPY